MSDETAPDLSGNRATVAQAVAEIRGLRDLTRAEFANTQRQLEMLANLPVTVEQLRGELNALQRRVTDLENDSNAGATWRKVNLPSLILGVCSLAVSVALLIYWMSH